MDHPLTLLARAFDTKGYPDDKNPDHWKTINHAPTHIDENGNIDGGAGGKFHGKPWHSTKYPHKPESYPQKKQNYEFEAEPLESLAEATKPEVTAEDLESAWAKVVKYKVAMNQSKSEKTYQKHSKNLLDAIDKYKSLYNEAGPDVPKKKHNAEAMVKHANKAWSELPKNQTNQDPLGGLAALTPEPQTPPPAPTNPNAPNGAYTPDPSLAEPTNVFHFANKVDTLQKFVEWCDFNIANEGDYETAKKILDQTVNSTNYDKFTLAEKKKIWHHCNGKKEYIDIVKKAQDLIGKHSNPAPDNTSQGSYVPDPSDALYVSGPQSFYNAFKEVYILSDTLKSGGGSPDDYNQLKGYLDWFVNETNFNKFSPEAQKELYIKCGGEEFYNDTVKKAQDLVGEYLNNQQSNANINKNPLESLANAVKGQDLTPATKPSDGSTWGNMAPITFAPVSDAEKAKHPLANYSEDMDFYNKAFDVCSQTWKGLMKKQKHALWEYTKSYSKYNEPLRGCIYGKNHDNHGPGNIDLDMIGVNTYGGFKKGEVKKLITDMTEAINESSYNEPMTLRRGCPISLFETLCNLPQGTFSKSISVDKLRAQLEGNNFTDHGFCSCGTAKGKGFSASSNKIDMEIYTPAGTKMMYAEPFSHYGNGSMEENWDGDYKQSSVSGEAEMILQRGTKFRIDHLSYEGGTWKVKVQVIAQEPFEIK